MMSSLPLGVAWATLPMGQQEPGPYLASSQSIGSSPGVEQHTPGSHLLCSSLSMACWLAEGEARLCTWPQLGAW